MGRVNSLVGRLGLRASRTEQEGKRQEEEAVTPGPPHRAGWGASSMRVARERDGPPLNAGPQGTSGDRPFRRPDRTARTVESRSNQHPISKNPALLRHALTASRPALPALRHPAIQERLTLRPYTLDRLPRAKRRLSVRRSLSLRFFRPPLTSLPLAAQLTAVDWDNATALLTPASRLPPTARSRVYQHAHALFSLRAVPSQAVVGGGGGPRARGSTVAGEGARAEERAPPRGTPFAVVASIKAVSKIGAERRRVKTRFKAAVRLALTRAARAAPAGGRADGKERRYKDGGVDADRNGVLLADGPETDVALVPGAYPAPRLS